MKRPVFTSQSPIVLSLCVEAIVFPSGLKATDRTEQPCLSLIRSSGSSAFCAQAVTGRNNTIEIISGCICSKPILIALFIATLWGKVFAFPAAVSVGGAVSAASHEDEISAFVAHLEDRAVARRRPGAVSLRGTVVDDRQAEFVEEFQRRQQVLRVLSESSDQILDKHAAVRDGGQGPARHRRPARQIVQFCDGARRRAEGLTRQENPAREAGVRDQQDVPRLDPTNGVAQIAVGNPVRPAFARRVSRQPVALFPLFVPLPMPGVKDQEVVFWL